ncbi:hypothetical protein LSAT2_010801 [Lamellibrachia satsuma]|nr:hypothetical protein LSAT2_010801 [Lamellibrachia satsuma]
MTAYEHCEIRGHRCKEAKECRQRLVGVSGWEEMLPDCPKVRKKQMMAVVSDEDSCSLRTGLLTEGLCGVQVLTMSSLIILFILLSVFGALATKEPPTIEEIIHCLDDCQEAFERCRVCLGLKFTQEDGTDHDLVMMTINLRLQKNWNDKNPRIRFDTEKLQDPNIATHLKATIGGRFAALNFLEPDINNTANSIGDNNGNLTMY